MIRVKSHSWYHFHSAGLQGLYFVSILDTFYLKNNHAKCGKSIQKAIILKIKNYSLRHSNLNVCIFLSWINSVLLVWHYMIFTILRIENNSDFVSTIISVRMEIFQEVMIFVQRTVQSTEKEYWHNIQNIQNNVCLNFAEYNKILSQKK